MRGQVDVRAVLEEVTSHIETSFGVVLDIDQVTVTEIGTRATITLEGFNQKNPSTTKMAGNYVFWIKKLKPLSLVYSRHQRDDYRILNELAALLVGVGICKKYYRPDITSKVTHAMLLDMASSLRYHSYSPNSIAMIFESLTL
jgi:hypothetical protein